MATKTTTLFSLAVVKAYLSVQSSNTGKDSVIEKIADGVSAKIEQLTRRYFVRRDVTETLDGNGQPSIRFSHFPIYSFTTLSTRVTLVDDFAVVATTEYETDLRTGTVWLRGSTLAGDSVFPKVPRSVRGVYNAGFDAQDGVLLPSDVVGAGLDWVKFTYDRWAAGLVLAGSASMGGMSVAVIPKPPQDVVDALAPWKKLRL